MEHDSKSSMSSSTRGGDARVIGDRDVQEELDSASTHRAPPEQPAPAKSWITRGLGAVMQLPKKTPLSALYWTTPEGPMPQILHLPSRDGPARTIEVYVWVPPMDPPHSAASLGSRGDSSLSPSRPASTQNTSGTDSSARSNTSIRGESHKIVSSFQGNKRPCLVDFHGGGFVMGGPLEEAPWCAALARSGIITISVAYRLGPTWEFPAALHDAEDAIRTVLDDKSMAEASRMLRDHIKKVSGESALEIDTSRIALSGFSSGGNVALNQLLDIPGSIVEGTSSDGKRNAKQAADWPSPFTRDRAQVIPALLFFPSLDARRAPYERTRPPGMAPPGAFAKFTGRHLRNAYLPAHAVGHLRASPGLAPLGRARNDVGKSDGVAEDKVVRSDLEREQAAQSAAARAEHEAEKSRHDQGSKLQAQNVKVTPHAEYDTMLSTTRALLILPELDTLAEQSEIWVRALEATGKLRDGVAIDGNVFGPAMEEVQSSKQQKRAGDATIQAQEASQRQREREMRQDSEREAARDLGKPMLHEDGAAVRVHRIAGMSHGFTTFPDSMLDERTRAVKALVMEQARQWVVSMLGGKV